MNSNTLEADHVQNQSDEPSEHDKQHLKQHLNTYYAVFFGLLILTIITVVAAQFNFSEWGHIIVALLIAALKAGLVAAFFMHLDSERKMIYQIVTGALLFFTIMVVLMLLAHDDRIHWAKDPSAITAPLATKKVIVVDTSIP